MWKDNEVGNFQRSNLTIINELQFILFSDFKVYYQHISLHLNGYKIWGLISDMHN